MIGLRRLTYDWEGKGLPPSPGCYLRPEGVRGLSPRAYLVISARQVRSQVHASRWALSCETLAATEIAEGAPVYPVVWYSPRKRRRI